jgi:flagellar assembly protein FliH
LSDIETKNMKEAKFWPAYEMDSFETPPDSGKTTEAEFIFFQNGDEKQTAFIPLARGKRAFSQDEEAAHIVSKAHEEAAHIEEEAYEKGFAQGEKDGLELGEKKAAKLIERVEGLLTGITDLRVNLVKRYEKDIIDLIFHIAKKIVPQAIESDRDAVREILFKAVELTAEKSIISIRINPEDFEFVERLRPEFFTKFSEIKSITVTPDSSITRGGCLLEGPYGDVDARIETQIERIYQSLTGVYNETAKVPDS